jgi:hypothetical protein
VVVALVAFGDSPIPRASASRHISPNGPWGHVQDQGANLDFIIGEWGDPAGPERRRSLALAYRLLETGPSMMVIDAEHRRTLLGTVAEKVLARAEVIGTALAQDAFAIADPVLAQDTRVAELLGAWKIKI